MSPCSVRSRPPCVSRRSLLFAGQPADERRRPLAHLDVSALRRPVKSTTQTPWCDRAISRSIAPNRDGTACALRGVSVTSAWRGLPDGQLLGAVGQHVSAFALLASHHRHRGHPGARVRPPALDRVGDGAGHASGRRGHDVALTGPAHPPVLAGGADARSSPNHRRCEGLGKGQFASVVVTRSLYGSRRTHGTRRTVPSSPCACSSYPETPRCT